MSIFRRLVGAINGYDDYVAAVFRAVQDGQISDAELQEMHRVAARLNMTMEQRRRGHVEALGRFAQVLMTDGYVDEGELHRLESVRTWLGITPEEVTQATGGVLGRFMQMQEIQAGRLPVVDRSFVPVQLQATETAHLVAGCHVMGVRRTSRWVSGSGGASFRIARGVRVNLGRSRGRLIPQEELVVESAGTLILTSERVHYLAQKKAFSAPWSRVVGVEPYANGVLFYLTGRSTASLLLYDDRSVAPFVEAIAAVKMSQL